MTLRDFLDQVKDLPPETLLCVAEVHEAFGMNVAGLEHVTNARTQSRKADGTEAVEFKNGTENVLVIRW